MVKFLSCFFLFLPFAAEAVEPALLAGTGVIEEAQALALKKNRRGAAAILAQAIEDNPAPGKVRARLLETLSSISKVFFTDKGQKLFEAAQSSMFDNPDVALGQYREALALEDGNLLILNSMALVQIAKSDCAAAALNVDKARALNAFSGETKVLELRTLICQKNFETFREKVKLLPPLEKGLDFYVQTLLAQDFIQQKSWRKAIEILSRVNEEQPQFPEAYYLLTKAALELKRDAESWSEKYVSLCKGITPRTRRRFALEPKLCANVKEVADDLAKKTVEI